MKLRRQAGNEQKSQGGKNDKTRKHYQKEFSESVPHQQSRSQLLFFLLLQSSTESRAQCDLLSFTPEPCKPVGFVLLIHSLGGVFCWYRSPGQVLRARTHTGAIVDQQNTPPLLSTQNLICPVGYLDHSTFVSKGLPVL